MTKSRIKTWLLMLPGAGTLLSLVLLPLSLLLLFSLVTGNQISLSGALSFKNYLNIFEQGLFGPLMWKSIRMGLLVTASSILIGYPVAYGLAKVVKPRWRNFLVVMIIIPFFTSQLLLIYSLMVMLQSQGPVMTFLALFGLDPTRSILYSNTAVYLILLYQFLPYMVLSLYSSLVKIDDNIVFAARSMGASRIRVFIDIILPLTAPALFSGIILVFIPVAGSFVESNLAGGTKGMMIGSLIDSNFSVSLNMGRGCALCVLFLLIMSVLTFALQRAIRYLEGRRL